MTEQFRLILASGSSRRRQLLGWVVTDFAIHPADLDEEWLESRWTGDIAGLAQYLAREKALAISREYPDAWIIGADTTVDLAGESIGKPVDAVAARQMLARESGNPQRVRTGLALVRQGEVLGNTVVESHVQMRELTTQEIEAYVAQGTCYDKAGGYAIQEREFQFVTTVEGCVLNVIGLPLCALREILQAHLPGTLLTDTRLPALCDPKATHPIAQVDFVKMGLG